MPVGLKVEKKDARPKSGKTGGANMVSVLQVSNTLVLFSPLHFVLFPSSLCHSWKDFCIVDAYVSYLVLLLTLPTYTTSALRVTVPTSKGCKATYR